MTFSFTLTKLAHWRAVQDVTRRTLAYKLCWAFFGGGPVIILVVAAASGRDVAAIALNNLVTLFFGPFLMLVGFPLIHLWTVSSFHKNNAVLKSPQIFELTPSHLIMRGPLHNSEVSWGAFYRVVETRHSFLFYVSSKLAYFLPKGVVSAVELPMLRENLSRWLPGRVQLRGPRLLSAAA